MSVLSRVLKYITAVRMGTVSHTFPTSRGRSDPNPISNPNPRSTPVEKYFPGLRFQSAWISKAHEKLGFFSHTCLDLMKF